MKVKDQKITDRYAIYNSDCMLVMPTLEDESIKEFIKDQVVLVTGGGGFLGKPLIKKILSLRY